jgi:NADP-dependent 3-hydroxy acid dehydrogenase YdfG
VIKMNRLENITRSEKLKGKRVIVTGCGYKPISQRFYDIFDNNPSHDTIIINGNEMKMNIGTAISGVLAMNGADVHMVSKSEEKLNNIQKGLDKIVGRTDLIHYSSVNLLDQEEVRKFVENLPKDKPLNWVQSVGLGAGSYVLENDNPYLPVENIPEGLIDSELEIVKATDFMLKALLPLFRNQQESKIVIISSMSAIRGYERGAIHCAAKGALDRYANAVMIEKFKEHIYVSTIRPGGIDTGMYDHPSVQESVKVISDGYGCPWRTEGIRLAPPTSVGEAVNMILTSSLHVPSLNLVAKGQWPHEGS